MTYTSYDQRSTKTFYSIHVTIFPHNSEPSLLENIRMNDINKFVIIESDPYN